MGSILLLLDKAENIDLSFANTDIPKQASFARASSGSRVNASGTMELISAGSPRFDYDSVSCELRGLLFEGQRQNRVNYSVPTTAAWTWKTNVSVGDYTTTAPDGTASMASLADNSTGASHYIDGAPYQQYVSGASNTWSIYAKAGTAYVLQIFSQDGTSKYVNFNLNTGTVSASSGLTGSIQSVGNGIYRCIAVDASVTTGDYYPAIKLALVNNNPTAGYKPAYTGSGQYLYIWGVQSEVGSSPTSYIQTSGSAATRAADVLSFTIPKGIGKLRYVFDDNTTQDVTVSDGTYSVPTTLNRAWIKRIYSI